MCSSEFDDLCESIAALKAGFKAQERPEGLPPPGEKLTPLRKATTPKKPEDKEAGKDRSATEQDASTVLEALSTATAQPGKAEIEREGSHEEVGTQASCAWLIARGNSALYPPDGTGRRRRDI